jgi:hypothetical protein
MENVRVAAFYLLAVSLALVGDCPVSLLGEAGVRTRLNKIKKISSDASSIRCDVYLAVVFSIEEVEARSANDRYRCVIF